MKDYTFLYRDELDPRADWQHHWDLFISAYNENCRVKRVFQKASAAKKHWLMHNEYGYHEREYPPGDLFVSAAEDEAEYILQYYEEKLTSVDFDTARICVDITGFMRPHMMFLVKLLVEKGLSRFDVIYSEPRFYANKEQTLFSEGSVESVRQVAGFEGAVENDTSRDLLIVGAGYESHLIAEVAEDKDKARKVVVLGLPSLSADMYQQNAWRAQLAADALGESLAEKYFAPANDPFVTATVLSAIVDRENKSGGITNLYLAPLATKAQALGFTLYFLGECKASNASIIFPFSSKYSRETSEGISRIWKYHIEFPL